MLMIAEQIQYCAAFTGDKLLVITEANDWKEVDVSKPKVEQAGKLE